ncbi:DUF1800 domain-containing protein [Qipengyuania qiaonensis]|uniref:DUF1800 domain-containing protein n=1 Tax=Qipengyuania qiaonensis TaxID=2867240 RepID=A0ABS7JCY0_9SPHN|nr:DUF1800 domain-containing protein [Qipengyuania qiaonensis]MBX7483810.1 DUF1800 domain-containing protein [Qipengyuania qiaonensis]
MTDAAIALNRFGLGYRRGSPTPDNPRRWLLAQLERYDPVPPELAGRQNGATILTDLYRNIVERRRLMRQGSGKDMAMEGMESAEDMRDDPQLAEVRRNIREGRQVMIADIGRRMRIAVASQAPFAERLVHFWSNHFAVSAGRVQVASVAGSHEFEAIRPHIGGTFAELLKSAALHPAMLTYLDQAQSFGPSSPLMQRRRNRPNVRQGGLNENLAREILELHTLGVNGGYGQEDVREFAKALTGWTLSARRKGRRAIDISPGVVFFPPLHEPGQPRILGKTYAQEGHRKALAVLDDLSAHPATARYVATKLARHFAGDMPPEPLVDRLAANFLETGGNLPALYRTLVESPEAWAPEPQKFRQPIEWATAALRATVEELPDDRRLAGMLRELGQLPWAPPSPAGYDDIAASWAGPDALVRRVEVAERMARNLPARDVEALAQSMFPGALSPKTGQAIARAESGEQAMALLLVAPEMMRR